MTKTRTSWWRRPVDRFGLVIAGVMVCCLLLLAILAGAGVISEKWIPRFFIWLLMTSAALGVSAKLTLIILVRQARRLNVPDNPPTQRTGDDDPA